MNNDVLILKRSYVYAILIPLTFVLGLASGYLLWGKEKTNSTESVETPVAEATEVRPPPRFEVPVDDDPFLGPENAPIVIIEFSDFNCGYCRKWYVETLQPLMEMYPQQIRFVYRDFPILSQESMAAAQAAQCAHEQEAFWGYHDAIFTGTEPLSSVTYTQYAQDLNLDIEEFQECLDSERYKDEVENDARFAAGLGITGTPTFFVNGIPLVGAQPIAQFAAIIDEELAN